MGLKRVTGNSKKTQKLVDVEIVSALKGSNQTNPRSGGTTLVSGQTTTTNMLAKSTEGALEKSTKETSEQLMLMEYQTTTSSAQDFLAKVSQLLGSKEALKIQEAHSSLRYAESYGLKDLAIYSLRMSKGSSQQMKERYFKPSLSRWMNLGMTSNGRCLTARISAFLKTGSECSLSDILEENPDQKYFLSEKAMEFILKVTEKNKGLRSSVQFVGDKQEYPEAEKLT